MQTYRPANAQELAEIVRSALDTRSPLQVVGGDSKRTIGFPDRRTSVISTAAFDRIIDYDPAELVLTAGAGARLADIETLLAGSNQMLAFEPFDFAAVSGAAPGASTLGGVIAAGFAGSRRVSAGNVRDHLLGFTAVSGRAEVFTAGGRVVKNVTGYDVSKLMCGSWGQLAVLTEVTLKVLPRPRGTLTLCAHRLDDAQAYTLMTRALRSRASVAAAAYIPTGESMTLLRLEGFGQSLDTRTRGLVDLCTDATLQTLDEKQADELWRAVRRGAAAGPASETAALWRINLRSTSGVELCESIRSLGGVFCADWGGSLVHARIPQAVPADEVRRLAEKVGGHAILLNASLDYRSRVSAQHPEHAGVSALVQRVKAAFDPAGILDPHRFDAPAAS